eukprot:1988175-Prymnesium_polylepis.1
MLAVSGLRWRSGVPAAFRSAPSRPGGRESVALRTTSSCSRLAAAASCATRWQRASDASTTCKSAGAGEEDTAAPAPTSWEYTDPRVRALDESLCMRGSALLAASRLRRGPPSPWVEAGGALPIEILGLINLRVRSTPLPQKAKLQLSYQQQLVRKARDQERDLRCAAELELVKMALQPQRDRRLLEYERRARIEERHAARAVMEQMERQHSEELRCVRKELRADAAELRVRYEGEARAARVELEEQLTRAQADNRELRQQLRAAQRAARLSRETAVGAEEEAAAAKAAAEVEVARVKEHGRAWAKVREAEARCSSVAGELDQARERVLKLEAQASSRSQGRAAEHDELLTLRGRVKELRAKVDTYQARTQRRFYDVDPMAEENQELRERLERRDAEAREQLGELRREMDEQRKIWEEEHARALAALREEVT